MRKFTLFFASLFITIGAMAQTPVVTVTEIGNAPYQLNDEDATKIFELDDLTIVLDVTTASTLSGRGAFFCVADPAQAVPSSFSGTNTSYMACGHNSATIAYIAAAASGQHFSNGTIPTGSTIRLAFVLDKTNNKFKSYIGNSNTSWTMDRNFGSYEIATPKMVKEDFENANIYIGGGMAGNASQEICDATIHDVRIYGGALTIEEIKALPKIHVTEIAEFENGKIYTFASIRGKMGATEENNNTISTARTSVSDTDTDFFKWTVYKSANENYYLYNIGKAKFMGVQSSNNSSIPFADTPQGSKLTFKKSSNAGYPIMFSTDNAGVVNHSANHGDGLITWTGGWNKLDDEGSNHKVTLIDNLDETTLTTIAELVAEYEADNTEAVAELDAAIVNAQSMFKNITMGTGVGQYTTTNANYATEFEAIVEFKNNIESTNTPTPAEVRAMTAKVEEIIASFSLNLPAAGYYRIKAVEGWNDDARYLTSENSTSNNTRAAFIADANTSTIFYFDGTQLISYASGNYLVSNSNFLGYNGVQSNGSVIAFRAASNGLIGAYNISFNDKGRYLFVNQNNFTDAGGSTDNKNGYCFNLEEVTTLPVAITETGYATFFSPVAVEYTGIEAYYTKGDVDEKTGEYIQLVDFGGTIPAGEGAILKLAENAQAGVYEFTISNSTATIEGNKLTGTAATTLITKNENNSYYILGKANDVVGLYNPVNGETTNAFYNAGHKAYLLIEGAAQTVGYSLGFDWGGTTGIENIEDAVEENAAKAIYDITGRQIKAITVPGIYIIDGKKTFVK